MLHWLIYCAGTVTPQETPTYKRMKERGFKGTKYDAEMMIAQGYTLDKDAANLGAQPFLGNRRPSLQKLRSAGLGNSGLRGLWNQFPAIWCSCLQTKENCLQKRPKFSANISSCWKSSVPGFLQACRRRKLFALVRKVGRPSVLILVPGLSKIFSRCQEQE